MPRVGRGPRAGLPSITRSGVADEVDRGVVRGRRGHPAARTCSSCTVPVITGWVRFRTSLAAFRAGPVITPGPSGVGIAEGWRGTIVHRVELAADGTLTRAAVVDPSFFNWPALPVAMADTIVPDFPLANKSFDLFYAGNDL